MRNQLILAAAAVPDLKVADVEYNTNQIGPDILVLICLEADCFWRKPRMA